MSRTLLFEIGTEEIPSAPLYAAVAQLRDRVPAALADARLSHGELWVGGSPRRLAVLVRELVEDQPDLSQKVRGPSVAHAFDADGNPTKAAEGFARSRGVAVADLVRETEGGQEYLFAAVSEAGRPTVEVLPGVLAGLAAAIEWPKSMRWGSGSTRFSRPVRWLTCVYGAEVIPVEFGGLVAGNASRGHRFLAEEPVEVPVAEEYVRALERGFVMADGEKRAELIREGIDAAAGKLDAVAVVAEKVFSEVVNLVEWPTVAVGTFDESFLRVPREVLETAMQSHQRYFPVESKAGALLPYFIVVHNGAADRTESIIEGHQRVIRARLADASFFFDEDLKEPLEAYVGKLETIVFQERLGTVAQRVERVEALTKALAQQVEADPGEEAWAVRAAHLAKADLVTNMVVEFPALQGVMGRHYALASEEAPEVAEAILEHYKPRFAGDELPASFAGALVSMADKLDTMVGIFAAGMPPTGSADPYGLRRGALGILNIIIELDVAFSLDDAISSAIEGIGGVLPDLDADRVGGDVKAFILGRMETVLKDRKHAYDTIQAILAVAGDDPALAAARADVLTAFRKAPEIDDLSVAFSRAKNLSQPGLGTVADSGLTGPEETALLAAMAQAEEKVGAAEFEEDHEGVLRALSALREPIDAFFDAVLVMDEDATLRENRLRLLNRFVELFSRFADFSALVE